MKIVCKYFHFTYLVNIDDGYKLFAYMLHTHTQSTLHEYTLNMVNGRNYHGNKSQMSYVRKNLTYLDTEISLKTDESYVRT